MLPVGDDSCQKQDPCVLCDLHIHTTASDGRLTPQEVVCHSISLGLSAISICDHDTLSGYLALAKNRFKDELGIIRFQGLEVIPGIEMSSMWDGKELHVLGYFPDPQNTRLADLLAMLRVSRLERIQGICDRLAALNMPVQPRRVFELSRGDSIGRPHIAEVMVEKNYVSSVKEAFDLFLGVGKPAYVGRFYLTPAQCIKAIRAAKGIAVWAHPGMTGSDSLASQLVKWGLQGIEVYHPRHDLEQQRKFRDIAFTENLIVTGGSDFHGMALSEGAMIGDFGVSYESLEALKNLAKTRINK